MHPAENELGNARFRSGLKRSHDFRMLQPNPEKLDCIVRVVTPENVEFEYQIAGPFQRLMAFLFDFFVRILAMFALLLVLGFGTAFVPFSSAITTVALILIYFLMSWFYGVYFESRFNGRTLGKMLFKLRVISTDGRPINGVQAALRNLLRLSDVYPTPLTGLLSMTITNRFQRIGDLAAGTMVILDRARRAPWDQQPDDPRAYGLAELIPASFIANYTMTQTIGMYMENRRRLPMARRLEISRHLADPLIKQFDLLPDTSPDLLLCALYVRIFLSAQQRDAGREQLRQVGVRPVITSAALSQVKATEPGNATPNETSLVPSDEVEVVAEVVDRAAAQSQVSNEELR